MSRSPPAWPARQFWTERVPPALVHPRRRRPVPRRLPALDGTGVHPAVAAAARLISADPRAGNLTQVARAAGLSPGHLSRLFKAQTGIPLSRYRNQQRLHQFLLTYGTGQHPTALNAALAAGFGSYAQFYRVCRQETGRTPATLHPASRDDPVDK